MLELFYEKQEDIPAEYAALYTEKDGKWHLTQVKGLKTQADVDKVNEGLRKEREDHKTTKAKLAKWGDLDPDEIVPKIETLPELEAKAAAGEGKFDQKKVDEVVNTRVTMEVNKVTKQLNEATAKLTEVTQERDTLQSTLLNNEVSGELRRAAVDKKVRDTAVDDIVALGLPQFHKDPETGKVVHKELGVEPGDWLIDQQEKRPHFWPDTVGANSRGGNGSNFPKNPWSAENWNITEQGNIVQAKGPEHADRMAQAVGLPNRNASAPPKKG